MLTRFTGTPENKAALVTEVPLARLGLSEELAAAIVFIASDEASYITGHILNVDGGRPANNPHTLALIQIQGERHDERLHP